MKKLSPALLASAAALLATSVYAARLDENARPKDYSRDFQVPAAPTAGNAVVPPRASTRQFPRPAG